MGIRGYVSVPDSLGSEVYKEFSLGSSDTVRFHIQSNTDGTLADYNLSSAQLSVYFRAKKAGTSTVLIDQLLTKVSSGTTGIVTGVVKFSPTDWAADDVADCSVVIVNTSTADADTVSLYLETCVYGVWQAFVRDGLTA